MVITKPRYKKRTPEFVAGIQSMIDSSPRKSIKKWHESEFLTRHLVHEDIQYFSYRKNVNF